MNFALHTWYYVYMKSNDNALSTPGHGGSVALRLASMLAVILSTSVIALAPIAAGETEAAVSPAKEMLCDHAVELDEEGRLQPWTSYRRIIEQSMEFVLHCPTRKTALGDDPWYLITSKLNEDGTFKANQNNQGSNAYYVVETAERYLAYTGDKRCLEPARLLLERIRRFHTPEDWAWRNVPRTQDDSPDGRYTDPWSGVDKVCMVGAAYLKYGDLTGAREYDEAALQIAETVARNVQPGDATRSPLPFRVNLRTGEVVDPYTAGMVMPVVFFDRLIAHGYDSDGRFAAIRDALWDWVMTYPVANNRWSGYYEDVKPNLDNLNQELPLETARYMLQNKDRVPGYETHVPALLQWVKDRFGQTKRFGATSIREQDGCFYEMSSHTARYASVAAMWYAESHDPVWREEARAAAALATYSALGNIAQEGYAINYVGVGYVNPWFSDSYFDYLPHLIDTITLLPELEGAP